MHLLYQKKNARKEVIPSSQLPPSLYWRRIQRATKLVSRLEAVPMKRTGQTEPREETPVGAMVAAFP